jgi:hypothetical protein
MNPRLAPTVLSVASPATARLLDRRSHARRSHRISANESGHARIQFVRQCQPNRSFRLQSAPYRMAANVGRDQASGATPAPAISDLWGLGNWAVVWLTRL